MLTPEAAGKNASQPLVADPEQVAVFLKPGTSPIFAAM